MSLLLKVEHIHGHIFMGTCAFLGIYAVYISGKTLIHAPLSHLRSKENQCIYKLAQEC